MVPFGDRGPGIVVSPPLASQAAVEMVVGPVEGGLVGTQEVADVRKVMEGAKKTDEVVPVTRSITTTIPTSRTG